MLIRYKAFMVEPIDAKSYLLVPRAAEGVLDRMGWVAALLTAEAPLARGVAGATGHPDSVQVGRCCFTVG